MDPDSYGLIILLLNRIAFEWQTVMFCGTAQNGLECPCNLYYYGLILHFLAVIDPNSFGLVILRQDFTENNEFKNCRNSSFAVKYKSV